MTVLSLLAGIVVVLAITAATAYFVAQEFAYMSVDRSALRAQAADGSAAAERALAVTRRTSFMLSGAQLGITVTGLLVGYVAEPLIGEAIGDALGGVDVPRGVGIAIGTALALVFSTFVQMLFGELFPKNLAIARPQPLALALARSTTLYLRVFGWLITVFDHASNLLLRALRIEPVHDVEHAATARDLEHIVADSRDSGDLPPQLSVLLDRILDFPNRDAEHAMIPRSRVDTLDHAAPLGEVRARMSHGHSRYPVLGEDDEVVGVVHLQDVLALDRDEADATVATLMRRPLLVPTSMPLPGALAAMAEGREQLACVLDEYGGFAGVLTTEDLAEELVGEIDDEHDAVDVFAEAAEDGTWVVAGGLPIDELARLVDHVVPEGDFETVAGLAIAYHQAFPEVGAVVDVLLPPDPGELALDDDPPRSTLRLTVLAVERHVPSRLSAQVLAPESPETDR
ncbi:hemolysin family protein [Mumia sp. DW29H23]|uniref:hemolysin family protein n=1 Tax=Mumia sp. DW29H23 TaxID=3421241 RepID=UPI003D69FA19